MRDAEGVAGLPPEIDRIYFGAECCDRLLPTVAALEQVAAAAAERPVTLVLPFITQSALEAVCALLERAAALPGVDEVVANDLGTLEAAAERGFSGHLAAGRLINRQRRGPRLRHTAPGMPSSAVEALGAPPLDAERWCEILRQTGVSRVEFDMPPVGLFRPDRDLLPGSLWHPYVLVTTGRFCNAAFAEGAAEPVRVWPCRQSCLETLVELSHPAIPGELYSRGPAQYWRNEALPDDLEALRIDRIVELQEVPS